MKQFKEYILEKSEVNEIFKRQDEFIKKMIDRWKKDKCLKPFDLYFKWKNREISTGEWRETSKEDIRKMRFTASDMVNDEYDKENRDEELIQILDAIEIELINIEGLFK